MNFAQNYLDKFGKNFLVASMIPSLAFLTITIISLEPVLPNKDLKILGAEFDLFGKSGFLLLMMTVILGFTLTSLSTFIYKVFEGYVLIWRLPFLKSSELARAKRLRNKQRRIQNKISRLENKQTRSAVRKRNDLVAIKDALLAEYDLEFPSSEDQILPTRFGNILKAAETYPISRYRIDAVPIWPRLVHVIPDNYFSKVDQVNNQLLFLMNCTVLSFLFSIIILLISFYHFLLSLDSSIFLGIAQAYLILFFVGLAVGIIFMRASVLVVVEYGNMIRSSFDLFRRDLLVKLHLSPPPTLLEEQELWQDICDFVNSGDRNGLINFHFQQLPANPQNPPLHQNTSEIVDN